MDYTVVSALSSALSTLYRLYSLPLALYSVPILIGVLRIAVCDKHFTRKLKRHRPFPEYVHVLLLAIPVALRGAMRGCTASTVAPFSSASPGGISSNPLYHPRCSALLVAGARRDGRGPCITRACVSVIVDSIWAGMAWHSLLPE